MAKGCHKEWDDDCDLNSSRPVAADPNGEKQIKNIYEAILTAKEHNFCVNCGNELSSSYTVNYCPNCGHAIKNEKQNSQIYK